MSELNNMLNEHQKNYHEGAWKDYTVEELEWWVKLFTKRANHRKDPVKKEKDLTDAKNYGMMLEEARNNQ